MKQKYSMQELREKCFKAKIFPDEVLNWIAEENLWNLWVPQKYGGMEISLKEGLNKLKELAGIDGSLGWTVTLCSGANFFIGNLRKEVAREIFLEPEKPVCLGGSGGAFGTAQKVGESFKISGRWKYATGASYLTHFTLNARILENGKELKNLDGSPKIHSFLIPAEKVQIIEDWNSMGLKASVTHSFEVKDEIIDAKYSFLYNHIFLPHPIFRIHFSVFADLTLWVNYLGMAEHFLEEAQAVLPGERFKGLEKIISTSNEQLHQLSEEIEGIVKRKAEFTEVYIENTHKIAAVSVHSISNAIIKTYPLLGVQASMEDHQLNHIFRDYFTATQHHIFAKYNLQ